jgi:Tol biopolymer transport system component
MSIRGVTLGTLVWIAACSPDRLPGPDEPGQQTGALIVSSPVPQSLAGAAAAGGARGGLTGGYAYVSLPAGTVPEGVAAEVRNRREGTTAVAYLSAGGFDPIAVPAQAGDTLQLEVKSLSGALLLRETTVVPSLRPPIIVRTNPPPKKRDVPLNATLVVIFSEPINPATLTATSFRLTTGSTVVSGSLSLSNDGIRAEFVAGQPLAAGTTYTVSLSDLISGVSGSRLSPTAFEFTSASAAEGIGMSQIVYTGCPNPDASPGMCGLFVMNADGSGIRQLTEARDDNYDSSPAWSPDGREIAFSSYRHCTLTGRLPRLQQGGTCARDLYAMHADGSGIVRLTSLDDQSSEAGFPAWQPNGATLAFIVTRLPAGSGYGISTVRIADRVITSLIFSTELGFGRAVWSPDGGRLAFSAGYCCIVSDEEQGLRLMNADGSGAVRITTSRDGFPSWSPDGTRIAFQRLSTRINGDNNLFSVAPDGTGLVQLTSEVFPTWSLTPTWSPDGTRIAFKRTSGGPPLNSSIWVMSSDGSGAHLINPGWGNLPAWSPFGTVPH